MLSKINFLIKNKTSLNIIYLFFLQKFKNLFIKKEKIKEKKRNQFFLKNFDVTYDWFSMNAYYFKFYLEKIPSKFNYLEIGSYEGVSAISIASWFPTCSITCVDPWIQYEENENDNFNNVEKNFDLNCVKFSNIKKIKDKSDNFFLKNNDRYHFIYVDGFHKYEYVLRDCINSWKRLLSGGYLVCDDYIWKYYDEYKLNPCLAINDFLKQFKRELKVELVSNSQIFIKKL